MDEFDNLLRDVQSAEIEVLDREKDLLMWRHQDYWRQDGSPAQDARHEEFGRNTEQRLNQAKDKLKIAKEKLANHNID